MLEGINVHRSVGDGLCLLSHRECFLIALLIKEALTQPHTRISLVVGITWGDDRQTTFEQRLCRSILFFVYELFGKVDIAQVV